MMIIKGNFRLFLYEKTNDVGAGQNRLNKMMLMITHNIWFY